MSNRKKIVIACGLLTAGVLWTATRSDDEAVSATKQTETVRKTSVAGRARFSAASASGQLCTFAPGERMAYEVETQTEVEVDMARLSEQVDVDAGGKVDVNASPAQAHQVDRDWHIELVAVEREDDGSSVLAARIEDRGMRVSVNGGSAPKASAALSDTFLIRVDSRCGIREFGWRTEGDLDGAREQQLLAAGLGFVAPAHANSAHAYGASSFDSTGRYTAKFQYEDGQLTGEAVSYALGTSVGRGAPVDVNVLASSIAIELAADAWFESLSNERDLEFTLNGRAFASHFQATKASRVEAGEFSPRIDLNDGSWSWGILSAQPRDASLDFDESLRDLPLEDALARYRELVAKGSVSEYGSMLRDWLRANPEQTGELLAMLREGEFEGEQIARSGLFYALGSANTEEAKTALVDILRDWPQVRHQISAAHALSMVERPTPEMVELVAAGARSEELQGIERGSMALALGTLASTSEAQNPELAAQARSEIRGWLTAPTDDEQLGHALAAAGNAGHDELAADVGIYFDHENPTVRKHAAHAMRQMSPDEAYPHLEHAFADEDRVVRTTALETAASIARHNDQAPTETMIGLASESLVDAALAEERAAVALLGEAAKHGDERANTLLRDHLREQMASDDRNPDRIAAIGRSMSGHWKAAD
jgi:HEAT repeat protein